MAQFKEICKKVNFHVTNNNFQINLYHDKKNPPEFDLSLKYNNLDCEYGRILTTKGVYSCPFLANDHRGRCGSEFSDYARHNTLESPYCATCVKNSEKLFGINYELFE